MIENLIIIGLIVLACVLVFLWYKKKLEEFGGNLEYTEVESIKDITGKVSAIFAEQQEQNLQEMNLDKNEYDALERKRRKMNKLLREASMGDFSAKRYIKDSIKEILTGDAEIALTPANIDKVIPFDSPDKLTGREKTAIVFHIYYKLFEEEGFIELMDDYGLDRPRNITREEEENGAMRYEVTKEAFDRVYEDVMSKFELTYDDKLEIVAQEIYARYKGFGAVDMLMDFSLDEVDCGVGGIEQGKYQLKGKHPNIVYSHKIIFVTYSGLNIRLSFMEFESAQELERVSKNIYKFDAPYILSRKKPLVVGTMKSGARISVARPPAAHAWQFFLRMFDSAPSVSPEKLLTKRVGYEKVPEEGAQKIITLSRWIVRASQSLAITGGMGSGKTTLLRMIIRFIQSIKNIRVYEISPELNLQFTYPFRNISGFSETDNVNMHDLYNFGKKANANVNIIGESASAEMGVIAIESATVGSEMAIFTHHAKSARDLVLALRDNLLTAGGYNDISVAERTVVNAISFNIHLAREKGHRYVERITEIIPIEEGAYPFEVSGVVSDEDRGQFYKRMTNRDNFICKNIIEYRNGRYEIVGRFSDKTLERMRSKLPEEDLEEFDKDMEMLFKDIS